MQALHVLTCCFVRLGYWQAVVKMVGVVYPWMDMYSYKETRRIVMILPQTLDSFCFMGCVTSVQY